MRSPLRWGRSCAAQLKAHSERPALPKPDRTLPLHKSKRASRSQTRPRPAAPADDVSEQLMRCPPTKRARRAAAAAKTPTLVPDHPRPADEAPTLVSTALTCSGQPRQHGRHGQHQHRYGWHQHVRQR